MKILCLNSSNIINCAYNSATGCLYLHFKDSAKDPEGPWYCYFEVIPETVVDFLFAESPGSYFATFIRPFFRTEPLSLEDIRALDFHV